MRSLSYAASCLLAGFLMTTCPTAFAAGKASKSTQPASVSTYGPSGHYCNSYGNQDTRVVFLGIDRTIPNTNSFDRAAIKQAQQKAAQLLQPGWRLKIFVIGADANSTQVVFDDCRPGKRRDGFNYFTATPDDLDKISQDTPVFNATVERIVDSYATQTVPQAARSGIMTALQRLLGPSKGKIEALVLASDLLEGEFELLLPNKDTPINPYKRTKLLEKAQADNFRPDLSKAVVNVYGVGLFDESKNSKSRDELSSSVINSIKEFWTGYFRLSGAKSVDIN